MKARSHWSLTVKTRRIPVPANLDLVVTSFGGVGTSFFIRYFEQYRRMNCRHNGDLLKHCPRPPVFPRAHFRAIYIFGDPIEAVVSLFRRGYHFAHSERMLRNHPMIPRVREAESLADYIDAGTDRYRFETHFRQWKETPTSFPILFLRYEAIWDELPRIVDFMGLDPQAAEGFPARRARKSRLDALSAAQRESLESLYGSFAEQVRHEPDFSIKPAQRAAGLLAVPQYLGLLLANRRHIHWRLLLSTFYRKRPSTP